MAAYLGKYHVEIDGNGYVLSQNGGKKYYQKKRAPSFVNKFGGGDASYRDASFWQYFVQTNWRNGAKQLKFDDPGKFWKSQNVDTTTLEELTLSKALVSAGQLASGVKVNTIEAWRASATSSFGTGNDGAYTVSADATDAPIDATCTGTSGSTSLSATNASFAAGQKVLIVQSQGASSGQYELRTISSYSAGTIVLTEALTNSYTTGAQVLVVPQYSAITINSGKTLTAKAWNGSTGGVLALMCNGTTTVTGTISATGKGYRNGYVNGTDLYSGEGYLGVPSTSSTGNGGRPGDGGATDGGGGGGGGSSSAGTNGANGNTPGAGGAGGGVSLANAALSKMMFGGGGGVGGPGNGGASGSGEGGNGGGIVYLFTKSLTVTGAIAANGNAGSNGTASNGGGGGGGAGGCINILTQTATLGTTLVTATGGAGGTKNGGGGNGGAGSTGYVHISYATSFSGTTSPTIDSSVDTTLVDTSVSTNSTGYAGASNGKIYSWDGSTAWTEVLDTRQLEWFDSGTNTDFYVGDNGGTEKACAMSFQVDAATKMKGVKVYLKKQTGTPGDITVRIETNSTDKPSGTLVDSNATGTITAFTSTSYAWYTVEFSSNFSLSASTTYWIVLKTAAAANDNNYYWAGKSTSGYAAGNIATSTDGGSTWTGDTGKDAYFAVLGNATSVNCSLITKVGGTKKMYFGTGNPDGTENGDARLYSFDGSSWSLVKMFATATESTISSMAEFTDGKVYLGVGPQAKIYQTSDFSTFTVAKDIDIPQNPGYVYALKEYNSSLYAGGGSPELVPSQFYNGYLNYYDQATWRQLYPFDFTVIKSLEFYDAYLFIGTYHGHLYVYDTASLNSFFNFKEQYGFQLQMYAMKYFDDKLYIGTYPQDGSGDSNAGVWLFDRRGMSCVNVVSGVTGYRCFAVVNGVLLVGTGDSGYVYKLDPNTYCSQGWYQSSYFDANLPSISKLYNAVTIRHDALATGQSIVVYYKFAESDNWTTLGTSNTVGGTEKTLTFASGTNSKKISLKVELNTSTTTASPKLTEVILQYALYPDRKWQWTMRVLAKTGIQLLDRTTESKSAATLRSNLETVLSDKSLVTYTDVDGTQYNVLVTDLDETSWVVNQDSANEDEVLLTLLEA